VRARWQAPGARAHRAGQRPRPPRRLAAPPSNPPRRGAQRPARWRLADRSGHPPEVGGTPPSSARAPHRSAGAQPNPMAARWWRPAPTFWLRREDRRYASCWAQSKRLSARWVRRRRSRRARPPPGSPPAQATRVASKRTCPGAPRDDASTGPWPDSFAPGLRRNLSPSATPALRRSPYGDSRNGMGCARSRAAPHPSRPTCAVNDRPNRPIARRGYAVAGVGLGNRNDSAKTSWKSGTAESST